MVPSRPPRRSTSLRTGLFIVTMTPTIMASSVHFTSLLSMKRVCSLALTILNTVQDAKDNRKALRRLAEDTCKLVSAVVNEYDRMPDNGPKQLVLKKNVGEFIYFLTSVNDLASRHTSNGGCHRLLRLSTDASKIRDFDAKIRRIYLVFEVKTYIPNEEVALRILKELLERQTPGLLMPASPPPPKVTPAPTTFFGPSSSFGNMSNFTVGGNVTVTNISGDQNNIYNNFPGVFDEMAV
ncbi:hypothetical protein B0H11DRAFT_834492 [Mycena galericulata]|nr:hypothetical protein B0H11DRAFT_834492 [Mycena galericulata]